MEDILDDLDRAILTALVSDARISWKDLAADQNFATSAANAHFVSILPILARCREGALHP